MDKHYLTDPREGTLFPLHKRKKELIDTQIRLAHEGEFLPLEAQEELRSIIEKIKEIHSTPHKVKCHGLGKPCSKQMDIRDEENVLLHVNSVRIQDADGIRWIYPPNIGTLILCKGCWTRASALFEAQLYEVEV